MLKSKKGFTLLEVILTLLIATIVLGGVAFTFPQIYTYNNTSNMLSEAQALAQLVATNVENELQFADTLNIETTLPANKDVNSRYIYSKDGKIELLTNGTNVKYFSATPGFTEYSYTTTFKRINYKVLEIKVDVFQSNKSIYIISSRIFVNNLKAKSITGATEGGSVSFNLSVYHPVLVTSITANSSSNSISTAGQTMQFTSTVLPTTATNKGVAWSVSDTTLASIDTEGLLTPLKNGTVNVIATALDGSGIVGTKQIIITNQNITVTSLSLSTTTGNDIQVGGHKITISPTFSPTNATNKTLIWSVDNTDYATIDSSGVLTSKNVTNKSVVVTAKTTDGSNISATISIRIKN